MAGEPEEESGSPSGFGASPRLPTGVEMMNSPHLRPSRLHQGLHASEIPAGQSRALQRRQALEAQQRAYRVADLGRTTNSAADLAPVKLRSRGPGPTN
jgi:hypothetical protein